jgi:hypothetical protein
MIMVTAMTGERREEPGNSRSGGASPSRPRVVHVAAALSLVAIGCVVSPQVRQVGREDELRRMERKVNQQAKEDAARPPVAAASAPAPKKADKPPKWRPYQLHLSGGPLFRWHEGTSARGALDVARVWGSPSRDAESGDLGGAFGGVGMETTVENSGVTLGPLLRVGGASGEYVYPGVNSPDLYGYGQLVPFVGWRNGKLVSGLRLGGGLTVPGFLRSLWARNHSVSYNDPDSISAQLSAGLAAIGRVLLTPLALANHVDGSVEATTSGEVGAGISGGSDPLELVAPLH